MNSATSCLSTEAESPKPGRQPHTPAPFTPFPNYYRAPKKHQAGPTLVFRLLLLSCTGLVPHLSVSSSAPLLLLFPLQETAPATPVFANQLTACSVIAHQKTWVQMWWGAGARTQNEILVFQTEPRFNYSLNERLLKPSLLCCFSSPIVSQPCALLNHQLLLSCLDAFIKGDDAEN